MFSSFVGPTAGGAEYAGKKGIAVSAGKRAANHHTHHLLRNELPMGIAPPAAGQLIPSYFQKG